MTNIYHTNYVVFDLETSGLNQAEDRILELGLMSVKDDEVVSLSSRIIKADVEVSDLITKITGITQEMVEEGDSIEDVLEWFKEEIKDERPVVGHNILKFDFLFLTNEAKRNGIQVGLVPRALVDTAAIFKGKKLNFRPYDGEPHWKYGLRVLETRRKGLKFNLDVACEEMGIDTSGVERHRATGDIELTNRLYQKIRSL